MGDICISPGFLATVAAMVSALFGALIWALKDSIREARSERDRAISGWEATVNLGEKVVRKERRRA